MNNSPVKSELYVALEMVELTQFLPFTKIEQNVTKNQTTLSDLRAMLGTPFVIGKTLDDHKKVAGFMLRNNTWGSVGK
ncbi:MAG: hypothetical protein VZQ58_07565, partial [Bacteroidales bacterium]|nr:hypothetical protein [Bacteroidales bacterium]